MPVRAFATHDIDVGKHEVVKRFARGHVMNIDTSGTHWYCWTATLPAWLLCHSAAIWMPVRRMFGCLVSPGTRWPGNW